MRPSAIIQQARQALHAGDAQTAGVLAGHVLQAFGRHAQARLTRALVAEKAGDFERALEDLRFVSSAEPSNPEARLAQARIFRQGGDTARAREEAQLTVELIARSAEVLESALEILGVDADALPATPAVLGRVYLNNGWPALAERHARQALSDHPERVDVRLTFAEALWRQGRLAECEEQCKVVFDQANDCVRAAVMLAHILSERGRTAEGQDLLERAGEIDPEYLEARHMLASLEIHRLVLPEPPDLQPPQLEAMAGAAAAPVESEADASPVMATALSDASGASDSEQAPAAAVAQETSEDSGQPVAADDDARLPESEVVAEAGADVETVDSEPQEPAQPEAPPLGLPPFLATRLGETASVASDSEPVSQTAAPVADPQDAGAEKSAASAPARSGTALNQLDWTRELLRQGRWDEAGRTLAEIVIDTNLSQSDVDDLLEEAAGFGPVRVAAWKLLGDFCMRTNRPQAAAEAYVRAAQPEDSADE